MDETTESIIRKDINEVWNSDGNLDVIDNIVENRDVELTGVIIEHVENGKLKSKYIMDDRLEFFT